GSNSPQKRFRKKQAVKSPNPTKNKPTNTQTGAGLAKSKNYKGSTTNPQPDGAKQGGRPKNIRETCSTTPHAH
ncbi:hypothetical protein, partial [Corynebacterium sp. MSK008]|uniref:hypothetical protein n=1 Tax=Corynebacterium sp. MSK008 TaxID=3050188 RepID=UPI002551C0FD